MASSKETEMGLLMVIVTILWVRATARSGCTPVLIGMAPCLSYITGNSSTPASSCCSQLANVVQTQPRCLCSVLNGGAASLGITINQTQALALPNACNVQTPPVSQCNAVNGPTTSPADSPAGSPADSSADSFVDSPDISPTDSSTDSSTSPSVSTIPAGAGSKTVPSTTGVVSHGSSTKKPLQLVFFLLFTASCASTFTSF